MLQNTQPKAKLNHDNNGMLEVHSIFYTIQGEGPFAGSTAVFIRLAGCNLDCPWCDTVYTGNQVESLNTFEILGRVREASQGVTKLIVITGGEPFRQDFSDLVSALRRNGYKIQIETNGTLYVKEFPYVLATIVCSPKIGKIHKELIPYIRHYKYVAEDGKISLADGLPIQVLGNKIRAIVARPPEHGVNYKLYLQPMDCQDEVQNEKNLKAVVNSCLAFGHTLCLQMHKIAGVE